MGNRGVLHDEGGRIRRPWGVTRWLLCRLEFRGRSREVMAPGRYTELFFLDEATGLAAGHRPCYECRRRSYDAYADAWAASNPGRHGEGRPAAGEIDARLHAERVGPGRSKRTQRMKLDDLPDGVFVATEGRGGDAWLVWGDRLLAWSPGGYRERRPRRGGEWVSTLTPISTVGVIRAGYVPEVHPSAGER